MNGECLPDYPEKSKRREMVILGCFGWRFATKARQVFSWPKNHKTTP
jgi:hypothetical protein